MSDYKELRQVIETNFRLNILQTRELGALVKRDMGEISTELRALSVKVEQLGQRVEHVGESFASAMDKNTDRELETLDAIRQILDNSFDLHKTTADHEQRIRRLEDRAS